MYNKVGNTIRAVYNQTSNENGNTNKFNLRCDT